MQELTAENAVEYLQRRGNLPEGTPAVAEALAWGVSNVVLRVHVPGGADLVLKQSREKLQTKADWRSRLDRIWRESDVLQALEQILPQHAVPHVLFEDRDNYLFAMTAVDAGHVVWKEALLRGETDESIARRAGELLARVHVRTAHNATLRERWADKTVFDELRLDPFYRFVARRHDDLSATLDSLVDDSLERADCLVLADFSPKNILLTEDRLTLVDFETAHYGDPAFDLGFFLSHLLLKAIHHRGQHDRFLQLAATFWQAYSRDVTEDATTAEWETEGLQQRSVQHTAACMLARIDGKSPVDYLHETGQQITRDFALSLFAGFPDQLTAILDRLRATLE